MILRRIYDNILKLGSKTAFIGSDSCTYRELGQLSAGIADLLQNDKICSPVIVYGGKSSKMLACMLGCAFAGLPYVPVDTRTPQERLLLIESEVGAKRILCADELAIRKIPLEQLTINENPNRAFYIIMTSGSTGKPKGVAVSEANLDAFYFRYHNWMGSVAVSLGHASFAFDLSVADIFPVLADGGCVCSIPADKVDDSRHLISFICSSACEQIITTPSFMRLLLAEPIFREKKLPSLQSVFFCGETLPAKTVLRLYERFPKLRIVNAYGPTECTVATHAVEITREMANVNLPAGIADENVIIEQDEIILGGDQVALGYIGDAPGESFFERNGKRYYRTGDMGRICDGLLYIGGRIDRQIKLHGYRIEPGEIEQALLSLPRVTAAAVFALRGKDGLPRALCGVVVSGRDTSELCAELAKLLPAYMIPTLHQAEALPLNANGKCDYTVLEATYGKR